MSDVSPERALIRSILKQAFVDIINCPSANPDPAVKYRAESKHAHSADAKRFINKSNLVFIDYCILLDLEPEYVERKFFSFIKSEIEYPTAHGKIHDLQKLSVST
jgi:hypothetical protein